MTLDSFIQILEASEKQLAARLARKGDTITSEDIATVLGDHMRTIEQLQQLRDTRRQLTSRQETASESASRKAPPAIKRRKNVSSDNHVTSCQREDIDNDSDSTIENGDIDEPMVTPIFVRKSSSLDEAQFNGTLEKCLYLVSVTSVYIVCFDMSEEKY